MATIQKSAIEKTVPVPEEPKKQQKRKGWFRSYWKILLGGITTTALLAYLLWSSNPRVIWQTLKEANYLIILSSCAFTLTLFTIKTIRWQVILKQQEIPLPFFEAFQMILIGTFGSAVTPAKVGDVLRAFYLKEKDKQIKIGAAIFSVVFDRLLDLAGIFGIIIVSLPFCLLTIPQVDWHIPVGLSASFLIFIMLLFLTFNKKITQPLLNFLVRIVSNVFLKGSAKDSFTLNSKEMLNDFYYYQKNYKLKHYCFLSFLSFLFWILLGCQGSVLLLALHTTRINVLFVIVTLAIAAIVAMSIPISISGLGVRDFVIQSLLVLLISSNIKSQALNLSILQTMENVLLPAIVGGLILLLRSNKNKCPINKMASSKEQRKMEKKS